MTSPTRRGFLSTVATAGAAATGALPTPVAGADGYDANAMAAEISAKLFAG